ncbi:flagellar basal body-associated protein FliL [Fictibacillus enclensis]|uniref:flagellar basal body-associated protein FliL n=1 Tax=Fictibacillus enclensis TaxID=1017270 RepID=UPI0025A14C7F|nr:flagellar basal body-associated protein FliL [Fictibacillus enclensis]MDM5198876.1 flagellar basal body-associated protein FliL [Fictibacillus enclensis]
MENEVKKSPKNWAILIIFSVLAVCGIAAYFVIKEPAPKTEAAEPSAEELEKITVETEEITTNLADRSFIKIKFKIQADGDDGKTELEKRLFQVNNIIIYELSGMKTGDLQGQKGIRHLEDLLKGRINKLMQEGSIKKVYTTEKIIQ